MLEMSTLKVSYICPECSIRVQAELSYLKNSKEIKYTRGYWCQRCNARHKIDYSITVTKNSKVKFKVKEFLSEDKIYKKRFSIVLD